ncbi:MAG: ATP-dependent RNA helicase HrpA [Magnetococcales bacterium]|nr:ATP-dependent RNA helicase HrpA [Magnetococcales bacterium]NGZ26173.1 ATP-dependent RNA helicase HrpA [Magnetococcales bacterium]
MARIVPHSHAPEINQLEAALPLVFAPYRASLQRKLAMVRRLDKSGQELQNALQEVKQALVQGINKRIHRISLLPQPHFHGNLPVVERRQEIADLIAQHQVVVLCGETGSGKTTQLPKICLELGRGVDGLIGVTQPRRIAARAIADYLAKDLGQEVGKTVGCQVRFQDRSGPDTLVKVMTDGILLAEIPSDRLLTAYDTLIIDEAHERNLNIDFILGYLKQLLPQRPELKIIISSATLDTEKFSRHFNQAPILQVAGRTYPVEVRYRPVVANEEGEIDLPQAVTEAVGELASLSPNGDILVFLPGEREIRECGELLAKRHPPGVEIIPLYARLAAAQQDRVFHPEGKRRIVLATNVAETSLTVPGIHYVVDSGLARLAQYNPRLKVQRLPVEAISQASANQRKGRCGRLAPGICIRLYSQEDFLQRNEFTPPEVLRASLAAVILRMKELGLGAVEDFPFIDPPLPRAVREGSKLLQELGALDRRGNLTPVGRELAKLPLDPRLGRILLAARDLSCLAEALILVAALSIQDPRERPLENRDAADSSHKRFLEEGSDFMGMLKLWQYLEENRQESRSKTAFRKLLRENHLSVVRVMEWQEIHYQLSHYFKETGARLNQTPAVYSQIHKALLAGLLANIGVKDDKEEGYLGPHGMRFHIFPASALYRASGRWVMAAEFMETSRLFALTCARIEPEWLEEVGGSLCRRHYSDPHWERKTGQVIALMRVTLHGLTLVHSRRVAYGPIDPVVSRQIFIQSALVQGEWNHRRAFFQHNQRLIQEIRELEARNRRRDLLVNEEEIYQFYDQRVPAHIHDMTSFDRWLGNQERRQANYLHFSRQDLLLRPDDGQSGSLYPGHLTIDGQEISLIYQFEPGQGHDGVTARIPLPLLPELASHPFEWLVPGMLEEKIAACLKCLPGRWRRYCVPLPQTAQAMAAAITPYATPLLPALLEWLYRHKGVTIPPEEWSLESIPLHLQMNFQILDPRTHGVVAQGRNLAEMRSTLRQENQHMLQHLPATPWERSPITTWDISTLPERVEIGVGKSTCYAYPAFCDNQGSVALHLLPTLPEALAALRPGLRRLFLLQIQKQAQQMKRNLPIDGPTRLAFAPLGTEADLRQELLDLAADRAFFPEEPLVLPRDKETFQQRLQAGRLTLDQQGRLVTTLAKEILAEYHQTAQLLRPPLAHQLTPVAKECQEHLHGLIYKGCFLATPRPWLNHLARYVKAIRLRLQRRLQDPAKDDRKWQEFLPYWKRLANRKDTTSPLLQEYIWLLEEYRVSLFAQELRTAFPISNKRLDEKWREVEKK